MPDLSIIIPTCNRAASLAKCIAAVRGSAQASIELVVVDGASEDGTTAVLSAARDLMGDRLRIIREERREGFVRAANKGFRAAGGKYLMWLNDDARPLPGAIDGALRQMVFSPRTVGMVAMFHAAHTRKNVALEAPHLGRVFHVLHVRGTLYANFGIASRELFERLGYFDERYYLYAADPDFSLKVWHAGFSVVPAPGSLIDHDEVQDARRHADREHFATDNARLFEKWDLPQPNPDFNEFDQTHPCTLRGLRRVKAA